MNRVDLQLKGCSFVIDPSSFFFSCVTTQELPDLVEVLGAVNLLRAHSAYGSQFSVPEGQFNGQFLLSLYSFII